MEIEEQDMTEQESINHPGDNCDISNHNKSIKHIEQLAASLKSMKGLEDKFEQNAENKKKYILVDQNNSEDPVRKYLP